jgi:hypothetical protein
MSLLKYILHSYVISIIYFTLLIYYPIINQSYFNLISHIQNLKSSVIIFFILPFLFTKNILKIIIIAQNLLMIYSYIKFNFNNYSILKNTKQKYQNENIKNQNENIKNNDENIYNKNEEKKEYIEFANSFLNSLDKK